MRVNGNGKPVSPGHWGLRCFLRQKKAIWEMILIHSFLFRYVSDPPPLRGTSFHRKEGVFQMQQTQKAIPFNGREWAVKT